MADRPLVGRIIDWLRAGYPQGVPERDYNPLLAILRRQLSAEEVEHVSGELISEAAPPPEPISKIDAGVKITAVTHELPHDDDVSRVQRYLEEHGFPFDDAPLAPPSPPDGRGARSASDEPRDPSPSDGPPSPSDGRGARSASDEPRDPSPSDGRGARSASDEPRDPSPSDGPPPLSDGRGARSASDEPRDHGSEQPNPPTPDTNPEDQP
ncbi:DUF3349 domain-containing protein [Gordonia sp. VNQ95]|uniref:DUF3349 domain-containing protein n=1 Tax=Gordonia sp. VNQ95 TaxID=3156619 RepID=UPI0032B44DAB